MKKKVAMLVLASMLLIMGVTGCRKEKEIEVNDVYIAKAQHSIESADATKALLQRDLMLKDLQQKRQMRDIPFINKGRIRVPLK